jgi:L-iditol 2-dehydrogenase
LLVAEGIKTIVAGASADQERLVAALRIGAAAVINVGQQDLNDAIRGHTGGGGVDVAFECAGHPGSVRGCLESLRPMGRYTQVAICGQDIQFPIDLIFYKQLTMSGSVCYTARTWERMMKIYAEGRVRLNDLISTRLPLSEWQTAFRLCDERKAIKVLMYPE